MPFEQAIDDAILVLALGILKATVVEELVLVKAVDAPGICSAPWVASYRMPKRSAVLNFFQPHPNFKILI